MSEVKRFEMEKEYSLDINIVPTEYPDGSFVHYDDYAALQEQLALRDAQIAAIDSALCDMAGTMLNRTLDSGSKQAVAYAECADMVGKFARQLRKGK